MRTFQDPGQFDANSLTYYGEVLSITSQHNHQRILTKVCPQKEGSFDCSLERKVILRSQQEELLLDQGDQFLFRSSLKDISTNKNPLSFDLKSYWNKKGYYQSGYINQQELLVVKSKPSTILDKIRSYISQTINKNFEYNSTKGIAKALLLGDKSELDPDIKSTFMNAGAMHVLAVSGLHVGLMAILFGLPLIPLARLFPSHKRKLKLLVLIPVWIFAAICGFSPSVTRAAIMISFYLIADSQARAYLGINILALTALLLLIYNPNYLFDVGFQLSFMAVLGLLLVYRQIRKIYYPKNKAIKYIWELTCVTVAVQLFLIPILFYHFHRFPIYFIPNSIVAVSSLSLIIYSGLAMVLVSANPTLAHYFSWVFEHLILALNYILSLTNKIPHNNIEDIWISPLDVLLLFIMAIGFSIWLYTQNHRHIWFIIIPFLLFVTSKSIRHCQDQQKDYIASYSIPYQTGIDISNLNTMYSFSSADSIHPFVAGNVRSRLRIQRIIDLDITATYSDSYLRSASGIIYTPNERIIILSKKNIDDILRLPSLKIDYLFLHGKLGSKMNLILDHHQVKTIIKDCSSRSIPLVDKGNYSIINSCEQGWINHPL